MNSRQPTNETITKVKVCGHVPLLENVVCVRMNQV